MLGRDRDGPCKERGRKRLQNLLLSYLLVSEQLGMEASENTISLGNGFLVLTESLFAFVT